ncbi:MAG: geranylgeranylglycerol-phosphate geranylgeranyltransferase [Candidatus Poribacteria bacterium]|nr:geranylgeranylglycerol-phosphate geranylgeranyltransferase [Candidatus Poribacteria bacterium]MDE0502991.1 geranylgeranylglycerol-phosphate geranylgeranyltransferase [Candidatus Poribacteria bacterium]
MSSSVARLRAFLELSRPANGVIAFAAVMLGGLFAVEGQLNRLYDLALLKAAGSALLLLAAGNALNDYRDSEIDRTNKPRRPIPSGRIRRSEALITAVFLMGAGIALGCLVNRYVALIGASVAASLIVYALWLKRTPIIGNLLVGSLTGLTFIVGGAVFESLRGTLVPATFALLFTTAREIVKDIEDAEGDFKNNAHTIAVISRSMAVLTASIFMGAVIVFSPVPYLFGWYSWHYMLTVFIGVDLVLVYFVIQIWKDASKENSWRIQKWMKWDILVGLGAICIGDFA